MTSSETAYSVSGVTPEISVCVPVFNEEESVGPLVNAISDVLSPLGQPYEIVLVDDGSKDNTVARLTAFAMDDPHLVIVCFQRNYGQTAAMMAGIDHAHGRYLVTMDGDLQNDPRDIPMMLQKLQEGYDLVVGYRINRQDKFLSRKLPSKIANWIIGKVTGLPIRDNGCSLKVYRAEVIKKVPLYSDMHRFIPAMTTPMGARVAEVGVRHHARRFGMSKYGLSRTFKVLLDLVSVKTLQHFARRPLAHFSGVAGLAALLGLIFGLSLRGTDLVVVSAVTGLLFSLALFLLCLGLITSVIFHGADLGEL